MSYYTPHEQAMLADAERRQDRKEAIEALLDTPEYDTFEECFFGEVSSDHHDEFTAKLKKANALPVGQQRTSAMAAAAEWLISQAEAKRVSEAEAQIDDDNCGCSACTMGDWE